MIAYQRVSVAILRFGHLSPFQVEERKEWVQANKSQVMFTNV